MSTIAIRVAQGRFGLIARGCTWLVLAQLVVSGTLLLTRPPLVREVVSHLGYPAYFPILLGAAKLLAALAIGVPGSGVLAEWAYAGSTFDVVAVVFSHVAVADPLRETLAPLGILGVIAVSYLGARGRKDKT